MVSVKSSRHHPLDSFEPVGFVSTADTIGREIDKWAKAFEISGAVGQPIANFQGVNASTTLNARRRRAGNCMH